MSKIKHVNDETPTAVRPETDPLWADYFSAHPEARAALEDARSSDVVILHINDVYELTATGEGGRGGMTNAASLAKLFAEQDPIVTFGGDAFSSGTFSMISKGQDMVGAFNELGMDVAVIGNHEFDFDLPTAAAGFAASDFPWLSATLTAPDGSPLTPELSPSAVLERGGHRIGFTGLTADWEAQGSLGKGKLGTYVYTDDILAAEAQARKLRDEQGTDIEIALCHGHHDAEIAERTGIDVVLGGHDHEPVNRKIGDDLVIRAGSDLENVSVITIDFKDGAAPEINGYNLPVVPEEIPDDPEMTAYVAAFESQMAPYTRVIGQAAVDLDGRKSSVRTRSTSLGNAVADAFRDYTGADVALVNGGGLRSEKIHKAGPVTVLDVMNIQPFPNEIVTLEVTGEQIKEALENGLSLAPKPNGSFPQVSGMEINYEPWQPAGQRVATLFINGEEMVPDRIYRLATYDFLADGNGGYDVFKGALSRTEDPSGKVAKDVVVDYVEKRGVIGSAFEDRIRALTPPAGLIPQGQ